MKTILADVQVGSLATGKQVCAAEVVRATEDGEVAARFEECRFLLEAEAVLNRASESYGIG